MIMKLGKSKGPSIGIFSIPKVGLRSSRRKSDADIDSRSSGSSTKKGSRWSEDLQMLDNGVRTTVELMMRPSASASVPSSPISTSTKSTWFPERRCSPVRVVECLSDTGGTERAII